jgi:hypothetical protein
MIIAADWWTSWTSRSNPHKQTFPLAALAVYSLLLHPFPEQTRTPPGKEAG